MKKLSQLMKQGWDRVGNKSTGALWHEDNGHVTDCCAIGAAVIGYWAGRKPAISKWSTPDGISDLSKATGIATNARSGPAIRTLAKQVDTSLAYKGNLWNDLTRINDLTNVSIPEIIEALEKDGY